MLFGWLKGIISKLLNLIGLILLILSIIYYEELGSTSLIISIIILIVGSYLSYVSKQTVKNVKK